LCPMMWRQPLIALFVPPLLCPCRTYRSNHKSVLGIGGYARERGATLSCVDEDGMEQWLSSSSSSSSSGGKDGGSDSSQSAPQPPAAGANANNITYSLVAYPPKDNLEGRLYDWGWVAKVRAAAASIMCMRSSKEQQPDVAAQSTCTCCRALFITMHGCWGIQFCLLS
jgi:hypothetical protein